MWHPNNLAAASAQAPQQLHVHFGSCINAKRLSSCTNPVEQHERWQEFGRKTREPPVHEAA